MDQSQSTDTHSSIIEKMENILPHDKVTFADLSENKDVSSTPKVNGLAQMRTQLLNLGFECNSKSISKESHIYFESYIKKDRHSYGDHDVFDALIHQHKFVSFLLFLLIILLIYRTGLSLLKPFYVVFMKKVPYVIVSIGIFFLLANNVFCLVQ
jgi:hypothetical protein